MSKAWFDGELNIRKGDIVRLIKGIDEVGGFRVSIVENISSGGIQRSRIEGVLMVNPPKLLENPITGKIESVEVKGNSTTHFELREGVLTDDHVFVEAGEYIQGQNVLRDILSKEARKYLKICDSYISDDTIRLLSVSEIPNIMVLCYTIYNEEKVKEEIARLSNQGIHINIRKVGDKRILHARYILTDGQGWLVGHSLKDFGRSDSSIQKLTSNADVETTFDKRWGEANPL